MAAASAGNIIAASGRAAGSPDADAGKATPTDRRLASRATGDPRQSAGTSQGAVCTDEHRCGIVSRNWPLQLMRSVLIERATVSLSDLRAADTRVWAKTSVSAQIWLTR